MTDTAAERLQYLEGMRVAQSRIHTDDTRFYVQNAAGHVVKGPFLSRREAGDALGDLRARNLEEIEEEDE